MHAVQAPAREASKEEPPPEAASSASRALEHELFLSDAGRVAGRAIRAHGGWDAWLALAGVGYVLEERPGDPAAPASPDSPASRDPRASAACASRPVELKVDEAGSPAAARPEDAEEAFVASLPFSLAPSGVKREYAGVAMEHRTAEHFERVRCTRPGADPDEWLLLSFDRSSWTLKRMLRRGPGGELSLTLFSDPVDLGGVKVPSRRAVYALRSAYDHWDPDRPVRIETLAGLRGEAR